jgi:hypothetical protein
MEIEKNVSIRLWRRGKARRNRVRETARMKTPLWFITDNSRILAWLIIQWLSPSKFGHDYHWLSINLSLRNEWFFIDFQIIYSLSFDWFNVKFFNAFLLINYPMTFFYKIKKLNFTVLVFFLYQFWTPIVGFPYPYSPFSFYLFTFYMLELIVARVEIFRIRTWTIATLIGSQTL